MPEVQAKIYSVVIRTIEITEVPRLISELRKEQDRGGYVTINGSSIQKFRTSFKVDVNVAFRAKFGPLVLGIKNPRTATMLKLAWGGK